MARLLQGHVEIDQEGKKLGTQSRGGNLDVSGCKRSRCSCADG